MRAAVSHDSDGSEVRRPLSAGVVPDVDFLSVAVAIVARVGGEYGGTGEVTEAEGDEDESFGTVHLGC